MRSLACACLGNSSRHLGRPTIHLLSSAPRSPAASGVTAKHRGSSYYGEPFLLRVPVLVAFFPFSSDLKPRPCQKASAAVFHAGRQFAAGHADATNTDVSLTKHHLPRKATIWLPLNMAARAVAKQREAEHVRQGLPQRIQFLDEPAAPKASAAKARRGGKAN